MPSFVLNVLLAMVMGCVTVHEPVRIRPVDPTTIPPPEDVTSFVDVVDEAGKSDVERSLPAASMSPLVPRSSNVLLVGDSLAVGLAKTFREAATQAGYRPAVDARSGTSTKQWVRWLGQVIEKHNPGLVVVSLGTNDGVQGEIDRGTFRAIVQTVVARGATVVWLCPPAVDKAKVKSIESVRDIINSEAPNVFHSERLPLKLLDGIHASGADYRRWMITAWEWMTVSHIVESSK